MHDVLYQAVLDRDSTLVCGHEFASVGVHMCVRICAGVVLTISNYRNIGNIIAIIFSRYP